MPKAPASAVGQRMDDLPIHPPAFDVFNKVNGGGPGIDSTLTLPKLWPTNCDGHLRVTAMCQKNKFLLAGMLLWAACLIELLFFDGSAQSAQSGRSIMLRNFIVAFGPIMLFFAYFEKNDE